MLQILNIWDFVVLWGFVMPIIKNMIVVDGIDGSGKGFIVNELAKLAEKSKFSLFDVRKHQQKHNQHPSPDKLHQYSALLTCEPSFAGQGRRIREELIRTGSKYSALEIAQAYSADRYEQYEQLILPFMKKNKRNLIFQERGVVSSIVYQPTHARLKGESAPTLDHVLGLPGNKFCLDNAPEYLIIATLSANTAMKRLGKREKQDDAEFEKLRFQQTLVEQYEGNDLKSIFKQKGTKVIYINTDDPRTIEDTRQAVHDFWKEYMSDNKSIE